jgi:hypothetical protein
LGYESIIELDWNEAADLVMASKQRLLVEGIFLAVVLYATKPSGHPLFLLRPTNKYLLVAIVVMINILQR